MPLVSPDLTAVIRHLSGHRRGQVDVVTGKTRDIVVGASKEVEIALRDSGSGTDAIARLHRAGPTYELEVLSGQDVWVNRERVSGIRLLCSGDLIEPGLGGALLRYRLYPPGVVPVKSLAEIFYDSVDGARSDGRTGAFFARFARDLATQTTVGFRIWILVCFSVLALSAALLSMR